MVYNKNKTTYNECNTNVMQWPYSSSASIGDVKAFNKNGKTFTLVEATEDGYIELASGNYENMKGMLNNYDESRSKYDRWVENTRIGERNNGWDSEYIGYSGKDADNGEFSNRELGKSSDRTGDFAQVGGNSEKTEAPKPVNSQVVIMKI